MSQEAVGWLLAIYAGALVGWVAEQLTLIKYGATITTLAGMLAAAVGILAYSLFGPSGTAVDYLVVGVVSAVAVLTLMSRRKRHRHTASGNASAHRSAIMYAMKK